MLKRLFGSRGRKPEVAVIFDVGSDSVAGSVVHFSSDKKELPRVIYTKRVQWHSENQSSYDDILRSMKYTLGNIARVIQEKDFPITKGSSIYVTFAAPWFAHETRRAELERKTVFTVTQGVLDKIQEKEIDSFYKEGEEIYGADFEVVEKSVIDVSVNGYPTDKPLGKKAKSIDMSLYVSVAPKEIMDIARDVIGRVFHHKVVFQTSTLVSYVVSRDFFARDKDYMFVDVGGELTDVLVVRNNTIFQTLSFPLGIQFFYNQIAESLKTSVHEVVALLATGNKGALHDKAHKDLKKAMDKAYKSYEKHFESVLRQLGKSFKLPQTMYISGYEHFEEGLKKSLETEHMGHYSMLGIPFEVVPINETKIHTHLRYQSEVKRDLFIALSALYRNHI